MVKVERRRAAGPHRVDPSDGDVGVREAVAADEEGGEVGGRLQPTGEVAAALDRHHARAGIAEADEAVQALEGANEADGGQRSTVDEVFSSAVAHAGFMVNLATALVGHLVARVEADD